MLRDLRRAGDRLRRTAASAVLLLTMLLMTGGRECQGFFLPLFSYAAATKQGVSGQICDHLALLLPTLLAERSTAEETAKEGWKAAGEQPPGTEQLSGEEEALEKQELVYAGEGSVLSASGEQPEEARVWEALTMEELLQQENNLYGFTPAQKKAEYDWGSLSEYETLLSTFYAVDSNALAGSDLLKLEELRGADLTISKADAAPQILIYHTHSREAFADSTAGDPSQSIVGVGEFLAQILEQDYGYGVLHHTEEYDTVRDEAYAKSLPALEQLLQENPSIQVVIDLHRDSGSPGRDMTVDIDGRKTARFMFFNGISRSRRTGDIAYLANPNLKENLAFSFQMQAAAGEYYPGLTRKIYIKQYRYNMHLKGRTLLIELGDENNTLEEAKNACYPIAHLLDLVLTGQNR